MKHFVPERFWCFKQINIFRALAEPDANALAQLTTFKRFKTGESLCAEGIYLIKEGRVKIYEIPPDAAENVTREVLEPGEIFGAVAWDENAALPNVTAETLTEAVIGTVTVRNFLFFLKRKPHLAMPIPKRLSRFIPPRFFPQSNAVRNFWPPPQAARKTSATLRVFAPALQGNHTNRVFAPALQGNHTNYEKRNRLKNPFGNIAFRCPASRLALLIQNLAELAMRPQVSPQGTYPRFAGITTLSAKSTPKLSIKALAQLIGSSEEKIESLLNQLKQHKVLERRYRRIHILDAWQLKKIANAKMKTLPPQDAEKRQDGLSSSSFLAE